MCGVFAFPGLSQDRSGLLSGCRARSRSSSWLRLLEHQALRERELDPGQHDVRFQQRRRIVHRVAFQARRPPAARVLLGELVRALPDAFFVCVDVQSYPSTESMAFVNM